MFIEVSSLFALNKVKNYYVPDNVKGVNKLISLKEIRRPIVEGALRRILDYPVLLQFTMYLDSRNL